MRVDGEDEASFPYACVARQSFVIDCSSLNSYIHACKGFLCDKFEHQVAHTGLAIEVERPGIIHASVLMMFDDAHAPLLMVEICRDDARHLLGLEK